MQLFAEAINRLLQRDSSDTWALSQTEDPTRTQAVQQTAAQAYDLTFAKIQNLESLEEHQEYQRRRSQTDLSL